MKRREFGKLSLMIGAGALTGCSAAQEKNQQRILEDSFIETGKEIPARTFDVVIAGGGTAGVAAAIAAARTGAKTALIESKGYPGGTVTEGGTAIHSYYNLWKAFPGVEKRQVVKGIPQEIIDELIKVGGSAGHVEMDKGYDYDSVCTNVDVELYKVVAFVNTLLVDGITEGADIKGVIVESRSGREAFYAKSFVDCTAYGDLAARAGADFTEPNDYAVCNSIGVGNVDIATYAKWLESHDAISQIAIGERGGEKGKLVRVQAAGNKLPEEFNNACRAIGLSNVTTTMHDNFLMFIKVNMKLDKSPTDRDTVSEAELELRKRHLKAIEIFREHIPGCEKAFIARTSPSLNIRRGRLITCDYDISHEDVIEGRHFDDEIYDYVIHNSAPRLQIKDWGTYGIPYRAIRVKDINNLMVAGMMITSDHRAHMSTRNTVSCMAMGQAAGTAAAMCVEKGTATRDLPYNELRDQLDRDGVYFEA